MTPSSDLVSKPAAGRYFPESLADLASHMEEQGFAVHDYHKRLPILMENCMVECDRGYQLCSFKRMGYLAVFSLPNDMPQMVARRAVEEALKRFREIDRGPQLAVRDQQFVLYRAFLGSLGALSITQHVMNGVSRSYLQFRKATQLSKSASSTKGQKELYSVQVI